MVTPEENKERINQIKEKRLEATDFMNSWEEAERRKRSAIPTEIP